MNAQSYIFLKRKKQQNYNALVYILGTIREITSMYVNLVTGIYFISQVVKVKSSGSMLLNSLNTQFIMRLNSSDSPNTLA